MNTFFVDREMPTSQLLHSKAREDSVGSTTVLIVKRVWLRSDTSDSFQQGERRGSVIMCVWDGRQRGECAFDLQHGGVCSFDRHARRIVACISSLLA
jgi:hypothetical protein